MSIEYVMKKLMDNLNPSGKKKTGLYPQVKLRGNVDLERLANDCYESDSRASQMRCEVGILINAITNRLKDGYSVTIDGLGTFNVVAESRRVETENEIRAESIRVKSISFRAAPGFLKRFRGAVFRRG